MACKEKPSVDKRSASLSFSLMLKQSPNSSRGMAQMSSLEEFFESMASEDNRKKLK